MTEQLSEVWGQPLEEPIPTVWETFSSSVEKYPDNVALVCTHQPPTLFGIPSQPLDDAEYQQNPYLRWTFKDLKSGIERARRGFEELGVHKDMPLLTFVANCAEIVLTNWAAAEIGAVFAPINPRNLANKDEVCHMIKVVMSASPGQRPVWIAMDQVTAETIDSLPIPQGAIKIILTEGVGDWVPFRNVMSTLEKPHIGNGVAAPTQRSPTNDTIFFTSGTTSLPKGCWVPGTRISAMTKSRTLAGGWAAHGDKWCMVVPNNHLMGHIVASATLCAGAAVVYPGATFAPEPMMAILRREKCTHTTLVPVMVHALLGVKAIQGQKLEHLKLVMFGGALLNPSVLKSCIQDLGASAVENAWGMTEGGVVSTGAQRDYKTLVTGDDVAVGWVLPGTGFKACAPGETTPVPRGVPGELHFSSAFIDKEGYIGQKSDDFYFDAQGRHWYATGDQGIIDREGRISITGRYKDMIVRGGENISPAAIEAVLASTPSLASILIQVVGAPDSIAGEVPIAVAHGNVDSGVVKDIQDAIINRMGTIYVPDEVITLAQLGQTDFPRTMAGKVQKSKLAELVRKYRSDSSLVTTNGIHSQLEDDVKSIWAKAVGIDISRLSDLLDSPISEFADSITVMRVRDKIKRQTGRVISITDMAVSGTIAAQIKLLEAQSVVEAKSKLNQRPIREGPPQVEDMAHLTEDPELLEATKELVGKVISPYGLRWDDVEDVIPAYDFANVLAETGIFDSWNFKIAVMPNNVDKNQLRSALEIMLKNNRMLASFLVWDKIALETDIALHVVMRQDKKLFDQVIQDAGTVKTVEELSALALRYPHPEHATFPGPMFRSLLYYVEETKSAAFVLNVNHAVIDASYAQIWTEDFDRALGGQTELHEHVDYKLWADSYYSLRTSPEARAGTKWHLRRLKNIDTHARALWPHAPPRSKYDPSMQEGEDGVQHSFEVPNVPNLRKQHPNLTAIVVLKAALSLFNTHRTGHTHALFSNLEADRTIFPFLPKSLESTGQYEAVDVAGPSIESVINLIEINHSESVLAFLNRMQADQINLTKYASAPWREIISSLGAAGKMIPETTQTQIFNWVPGMGTTGTNPYTNFRMVNSIVRPQVGLAVNGGLGGKESSTMFLYLRGDALDIGEMKEIARDLEKICVWTSSAENLSKEVGSFVDSLA